MAPPPLAPLGVPDSACCQAITLGKSIPIPKNYRTKHCLWWQIMRYFRQARGD
tara:strand:+ start:8168 stop:8326 length:159 start_codon:yes stop_codon:yes gene_type:complete